MVGLPLSFLQWRILYVFRRKVVHFSGSRRGVETHKNSGMEIEKRCNSSSFGNGKIFGTRRRGWSVSSWLGSDFSIFWIIPSWVLFLPVSNRTCWAKSSSPLFRSVKSYGFMNETLWLESVVNPIYDRKEQLTIESNFAHYFHFRIRNSAKRRKAQFQVVQE